MQQISTTVVALVGPDARPLAEAAGAAANVAAVVPEQAPALERAASAWREAVRSSSTYVVHDADPLSQVVDAWTALYDGAAARDELAVAVSAVVACWRARSLELPDYYLVLDAEDLPATRRHWYLGVLRAAAPARVVPVQPTGIRRALASLRSGRWWPDLPRLLDGIDEVAPDAVQAADDAGALLTPSSPSLSAPRDDRRRGG